MADVVNFNKAPDAVKASAPQRITLESQLLEKKVFLESELKRVESLLSMLRASPELQDFVDLLQLKLG
jgi:hypothetical protein